ncbi:MAG: SPOR domain-containing protein [Bryobacteraceae bacterium]
MPKNEDGEFELVLANRQLLSVFFIVVILLGVFFTMGYIVGRNPSQVDVASHKPEPKPMVVESPALQETPAPVSAPPVETPARTRPQQPPPEEAKVEPKPEQPAPVKKEAPAKKAQDKEKPAPADAQPASGQTYLQISATQKAEADVMVDVLHQKKFNAIAVQIPDKPGLYRVLVGPLTEGTLNQTKSDLQSSGFPGDKAIKKVF